MSDYVFLCFSLEFLTFLSVSVISVLSHISISVHINTFMWPNDIEEIQEEQ